MSASVSHDDTTRAVRAAQVEALFRQNNWITATNATNAAIIGAVLWPTARHDLIVGWVLASALVVVARARLRQRYLRARPAPEEASLWARRFIAGCVGSGALWGLAALLFFDAKIVTSRVLLVFAIAGMTGGAAGTLARHLPAFVGYSLPALLPLAIRLLACGDRTHVAMGILCIIYGAALWMIGRNTQAAIAEPLRLRFQNEDLLRRLSEAHNSLAEINRTLEQRVEQRGAELQRERDALREARRMESLGLLAGGVAHDFNNLLTVVLGNALLLRDGLSGPVTPPARELLDDIRGAAERGAALVNQLLAFSRRQRVSPKVLDLNEIVTNLHRLLSQLIGTHIELVVELAHDELPVKADPQQLEQVLINLATNARDAMASGGTLTISTALVHVTGGSASSDTLTSDPLASGELPPGSYVLLAVRDTGIGMDSETQRLAFDPFFTTKDVGRGTGLGLATVYGIVEQSGGRVVVESDVGKGSCFRVYLPRAHTAVARNEELLPVSPRAGNHQRATVLLAEDDSTVRAFAARALTSAGFEIIECENGQDALERARARRGSIDLLLTDVVMPKMGGAQLARQMLLERPKMCVLYMSGHAGSDILPESDVEAGTDFLQKPFTPDALIARIVRLLEKRRPEPAAETGIRPVRRS